MLGKRTVLSCVKNTRLSSFRAFQHSSRHIVVTKRSFQSSGNAGAAGFKKFNARKASVFAGGASVLGGLSLLWADDSDGITVDEVKLHNNIDDCWIVLNGDVYDITEFIKIHPGGAARLMEVAGKDATEKFHMIHSDEVLEKMKEYITLVGKLKGEFSNEVSEEELRIQEFRAKMPPLSAIFNGSDFEHVAKKVLSPSTYFYYATGASDEFSLRENHYAYGRVFFRPKALQDVADQPDISTEFLGAKVDLPIYITAFAGSKLCDPLGEMNLQAASYDANVLHMVPKQNSYSFDDFFGVVPDDQNHWFQYHFDDQEELEGFGELVKKAEQQPSIKGIFLNVDLTDIGNREKDTRQRAQSAENPDLNAIIDNKYGHYAKLRWSHIEELIKSTHLPIALKGVQRGEDVVLAAEKGVKAVVLSNHGGRQLDFSRPPLEVLVEARQMLKEKNLQDDIEIYVDGGIRRGSDVIKAICLGAKGVGIGRPFLYAMAGYGEDGVARYIEILRGEIENNMRLLGVDKISDLNEDLVDASSLKLRGARTNDALYDQAYQPLEPFAFK